MKARGMLQRLICKPVGIGIGGESRRSLLRSSEDGWTGFFPRGPEMSLRSSSCWDQDG